jgi:hypothetical protein
VAVKLPAGKPFAAALVIVLALTLIGLVLSVLIPRQPVQGTAPATPERSTAHDQLSRHQ